ncbi:hypothetical protein [Streptomyces coerulescens]|uniref:Integral membrane protein n=1 Tax=Streptomyces coerulescens TaxID=29304 RepID=A0ABW0CPA8_STRCD
MQGHGYPQPVNQPPPIGWLVFLRVVFVVMSVLSFGLLMWVMMLRLAIVTRRPLDWWLFAASIVVEFLGLYLMGSEPGDEIHTAGGWTGLVLVLGGMVAAIAYYLSADIRHFHQLRFAGYPGQRQASAAYGYPHSQSPYTATTVPQSPPMSQTPPPRTPMPRTPAQPPTPPQRPAPARIDQVRAELDELSDYLRKHDTRQDGDHEGGR